MVALYALAIALAYILVGSAIVSFAAYKGCYKAENSPFTFKKSDIPVIVFGWGLLVPFILVVISWEKMENYLKRDIIEIPVMIGEWFRNRVERKREVAKQAAVPTKSAV